MSIWFTSDTHFGHRNVLKFADEKGNAIRPGFDSVEHMDETLIENWNACVKPEDRVYHLGDVIMGDRSRFEPIMRRLNGQKRLIVGNHDDIVSICATGLFMKVVMWKSFREDGFVCTHVPIIMDTPNELGLTKAFLNVHGHIHEKPDPSERHMNICVERTNYRPVHMDEIKARVKRL